MSSPQIPSTTQNLIPPHRGEIVDIQDKIRKLESDKADKETLDQHYLSAWQIAKFSLGILLVLINILWIVIDTRVNAGLKELYQNIYSSQIQMLEGKIQQIEKTMHSPTESKLPTPQNIDEE